jgi:AcrR family transcriptional regulator
VTDEAPRRSRRLRVDAAENRTRLLAAAKAEFTERGANSSLNMVARRAGVGPGTLYRHFPNLQTLLVAIVKNDVAELCRQGRELLTSENPDAALRRWLRAFATHAATMQGLLAAQMAAEFAAGAGSTLAGQHEAIIATGDALLDRAKRDGTTPESTDIRDVLRLANAIAWASQQAPDDANLLDRLFAISFPERG